MRGNCAAFSSTEVTRSSSSSKVVSKAAQVSIHMNLDCDVEIFDDETSRKVKEQHMKDLNDAVDALGPKHLGMLGLDDVDKEDQGKGSSGTGFMGKVSSFFSRKSSLASSPSAAKPASNTPLPQPPAAAGSVGETKQSSAGTGVGEAEAPPVPVERQALKASTEGSLADETIIPPQEGNPVKPQGALAPESVDPEIRVVDFEVQEPTSPSPVIGQLVVLEGSCYVWAAIEGSLTQGSLAAAMKTRFDGGMPTASALLASESSGGLGAGVASVGTLGMSMAQRLSKRTGRVVFVSCDLPEEDSQLLVAAVEAKVVALLASQTDQS